MRKRFTLFFLLLTASIYCEAQKAKLDSLKSIILLNKQDSNFYQAAVSIADLYKFSKPDSSIKYTRLAIEKGVGKIKPHYVAGAYNSMGMALYMKGKYAESIEAFQQYHEWGKRANSNLDMAWGLANSGNVYIELGDYAKAREMYEKGLVYMKRTNNEDEIATIYYNIGYVDKEVGNYEKALANFYNALKSFEKTNNLSRMPGVYNTIGIVNWRMRNYDASTEAHTKALEIQRKTKDRDGIAISLQSIATNYAEQQKYDAATKYYDEALKIYEAIDDKRQIGLLNADYGQMSFRRGNYQEALRRFEQAISISRLINNKRTLGSALLGAANASVKLGLHNNAKTYLDSAEILISNTDSKLEKKNFFETATGYYSSVNNYQTALDYFSKYASEKDSILSADNLKAIADMQVKYETEKKELQINLLGKENAIKSLQIQNQKLELNKRLFELTKQKLQLSNAQFELTARKLEVANQQERILRQQIDSSEKAKTLTDLTRQNQIQTLELNNQRLEVIKKRLEVSRKNIWLAALSIGSLLLILLGYSFYRRFKLKQQQRLQEEVLKQQELATKAIIVAEENERKRIAGDLHDGVGQIMSAAKMNLSAIENEISFANEHQKNVFRKALALVDESCTEVRSVSHNMMPNALLKSGLATALRDFLQKIDSSVIKIDLYTEGLNENLEANMEVVLYRVIQECVNNVIKHAKASRLDISLIRDAAGVDVTIEDDGRGFETKSKNYFEGIGLKNIKTRVDYLKGTVEWNSAPGKGTLVAIHIPFEQSEK